MKNKTTFINRFIMNALKEDIGEGDQTSFACIPSNKKSIAFILVKEEGVIAGVELAGKILSSVDKKIKYKIYFKDGEMVKPGDKIMFISGNIHSILKSERLILNFMQRMSGIATQTWRIVDLIKDTKTKLLDTRKTTPGFRFFEKWAVKLGGGENHRFGLYDMIMIKDNHIAYSGGIRNAILSVNKYLKKTNKKLKVEIEVTNLDELNQVLNAGGVHRIMLDNMSPVVIKKALKLIKGKYETEASGNINKNNIREYAMTGVDYISMGSLTHSYKSLDISLESEVEKVEKVDRLKS